MGIKSFDELVDKHGNGDGCEVCKPLVSNILASINNDMIFENDGMTLQDTNDRALANMQRGMLLSSDSNKCYGGMYYTLLPVRVFKQVLYVVAECTINTLFSPCNLSMFTLYSVFYGVG